MPRHPRLDRSGQIFHVMNRGIAKRTMFERAADFRNHGIVRDHGRHEGEGGTWYYEVQTLGLNYRLPDVLCALGLSQLRKLDRFLARRREIAGQTVTAIALRQRDRMVNTFPHGALRTM